MKWDWCGKLAVCLWLFRTKDWAYPPSSLLTWKESGGAGWSGEPDYKVHFHQKWAFHWEVRRIKFQFENVVFQMGSSLMPSFKFTFLQRWESASPRVWNQIRISGTVSSPIQISNLKRNVSTTKLDSELKMKSLRSFLHLPLFPNFSSTAKLVVFYVRI